MPENPGFAIPTRQKSDVLFGISTPLGAASSITTETREVLGYAAVAILAFSDQPFSLSIQEACLGDGDFVETYNLSSSLVAGQNQICERIEPFGAFMNLVLDNPGSPMTLLQLSGQGIPQP
jgi:hypothetical protein